ncbi:MAG: membrane protein insertase YidC [Actinomycetales bacterium]
MPVLPLIALTPNLSGVSVTAPSGFVETVMWPFTAAVSTVLVLAHDLLATIGDPSPGAVWTGSIVLLVLVVRAALLPLAVRGVRLAHAQVRAEPEISRIRRRYAGRTDRESLLRQSRELRAAQAEHGLGASAMLPAFAQVPVMSALYLVLRDLAAGTPVGIIGAELAHAAASSTVAGLQMDDTALHLGQAILAGTLGSLNGFAVLAVLAVSIGLLTWLTQRHLVLANASAASLSGPAGPVMAMMPVLATGGAVVAAVLMPAGLVLYWLAGAVWTAGQQAVVVRFWPTPTSQAAARFG